MYGQAEHAIKDAAVLGIKMPVQAFFELWAIHEPIYRLMRLCARQWRVMPMGGVLGLDLPAVKLVAETLNITWSEKLLQNLMIFEAFVLKEMSHEQS